MLTASTAPTDQLRPGPRLTESLPSLPETAAAAAVVVVAPRQLAPLQDHGSALRAPQVPASCSTEGPAPSAPTSYETYRMKTKGCI